MNTAEPLTEEDALWSSINEMPGDQLRRLVLADWYEERASVVKCPVPTCGNPEDGWDGFYMCLMCSGTGFIHNGFAGMAAALRATASWTPIRPVTGYGKWSWHRRGAGWYATNHYDVADLIFYSIPESQRTGNYSFHPTAAAAIRDLCRAWVKVHREIAT